MKRKKRSTPTGTRIQKTSTRFTPKHTKAVKRPVSKVTLSGLALILLFLISISFYIYYLSWDLPPLTKLEQINPVQASQVFSSDGELIYSFFRHENRKFIPFDRIPGHLIDALLSVEDRDFYTHWGINLTGIARSLVHNIAHFDLTGQGASTLTMQLARNLYFGFAKTWNRKIKEALTALQIERTYSKQEILNMYLNITFFGGNAYGIQAAAKRYFDKEVDDLTLEESALLVGVLKGQTFYSPIRHPDRALKRRNVVLKTMVDNGKLSKAKYDSLKQLPLNLKLIDPHEMKVAPYFTEYVRRQLNRLQDSLKVDVYEDGLRIYTSLNTEMQRLMELAVTKRIDAIQERVRKQWAFKELRRTVDDSLFNELTTMQIAFVALDPATGHILAMIGGRDYNKSKFNRVTQMKRQPGSSFKPFLYTAAIDNGYTPADVYLNQPTVEMNADGTRWTPKNFTGEVGGMMSLREALRRSVNLVAVRLIADITPQTVVQYARAFGITTPLRPFSSLALGSSEVIPLELVSAYGTFANNGIHVKPVSILRIEDKNGNIIYEPSPEGRRREVISPETNYIMNDILQDVIRRGTGYAIRRDFKFYQPAGGKTGTTNDYTNAWFLGYTPDIVAGVWVGLDDFKYNLGPGMTGAAAALPFWGEFMTMVYDSLEFTHHKFPENSKVVRLTICRETYKLATPYCPDVYEEIFNIKYQPTEKCDVHSGKVLRNSKRRKRF